MRLRVAPHPASSHPARVAFPGCPVPRSLSAEPASESSGCPSASGLRLCRRWSAQVAPNFTCLRRCWFQQGAGFPQWLLPLPAAPAMKDLGCPSSRISGFTGNGSSSRPDFRIFRRCRLANPRVAPGPGLSVSPTIRRPGCPKLRILRYRLIDIRVTSDHAPSGSPWLHLRVAPDILPWLRQSTNFQVALNLGSPAVRRFPRFESPRTLVPRLIRICFRESPRFCIYG
jgi:hypothetical protein